MENNENAVNEAVEEAKEAEAAEAAEEILDDEVKEESIPAEEVQEEEAPSEESKDEEETPAEESKDEEEAPAEESKDEEEAPAEEKAEEKPAKKAKTAEKVTKKPEEKADKEKKPAKKPVKKETPKKKPAVTGAKKKLVAQKKVKKKKIITGAVWGGIALLLVAGIAFLIIYNSIYSIKETQNYSEGLADTGFIEGVSAKDIVTLAQYNPITVDKSELEATQEEIDEHIKEILENNKELSEDATVAIKDGDEINLDYVGSIDGEEFEGGNSNGEGYDLVIGSGSFIDGFESQLVGHKPGENFDINVTFPEDYGNEELNGKPAVFNVTINGIYNTVEFTDAFVKENYPDQYNTTEELLKDFKEEKYKENFDAYVQKYYDETLIPMSELSEEPEAIIKAQMGLIKKEEASGFVNQKSMYDMYGIDFDYKNVYEYEAEKNSKKAYYEHVRIEAGDTVKEMLVNQAIFEKEGLTISEQNILDALDELGIDEENKTILTQARGEGYLNQKAITYAVKDFLNANFKVNE